jgi:Arc/MetJ-type ribon-helix-helix transcriptional regulator
MRTVSFKLPAELDEALDELARRRRASRSAVVREALEALTREGKPSVVARAADLVGCLEGPGDLSTNPDYMKDFGR